MNNKKIKYLNGDIYCGGIYNDEFIDNIRHGIGVFKSEDGDIYEGEWRNDDKHGKGIMKYIDGDIYEGEWKDDVIDGKGVMKYSNGDIYEGEWKNDKMNGKGIMKYASGIIYDGQWNYGKKHGDGKLTINKITYDCKWDNDKNIKDKTIKSVEIKNQENFDTCWAHSISRTFVRTLQILDIIQSTYAEQFYLLFYYILLLNANNECFGGNNINKGMFLLLNYLKNINSDDKVFNIKYNEIKCYNVKIPENEKNKIILDNLLIIKNFVKNIKFLINENLLFLACDRYDITNINKENNPTKAIKTMLYYKLQPSVTIFVNIYLDNNISNINYLKRRNDDIFPSVEKTNIKDLFECININNPMHVVNLRRWLKNGIEFKNSWGKYVASEGNFSVPDLHYLSCNQKDKKKYSNIIIFDVLMFDYDNLTPEFKEKVDCNIKKFIPMIDDSLEIIKDNKKCNYNKYGFLDGYCEEVQTEMGIINGIFNNGIIKNGVINYKDNSFNGIMKYEDNWFNGDIYEGEFKYELMNGKGIMKYSNGNIYDGEWKDNTIDGKGVMKYSNGDIYEGNWLDDDQHGKGKMKYANCDIYEGEWFQGNKYKGVMKYSNGDIYNGEWDDNKDDDDDDEGKDGKDGKGTMKYANGDKYQGEWKNNKKNGKGVMIYANGKIFEGKWENDKLISVYSNRFKLKYLKYKKKYLELNSKL